MKILKQLRVGLGVLLGLGGSAPAAPLQVLSGAQRIFFVSPSGSDSNPGTAAAPLLTPNAARLAVRAVNGAMTGDIAVVLRGGTYTLTSTLAFTSADGGTNGHSIVWRAYPGELPILSGGRAITGWAVSSGSIYSASAPSLTTRQLFVNGVRCYRVRAASAPTGETQTGTGYTWADSSLAAYAHPEDLEFVYRSQWTESRLPVASASGTTITMVNTPFAASVANTYTGATAASLYRVENAYELLGTPGQFYNNAHTGTLYYVPRAGENMATASVVAPALERIVTVTGAAGAQVSNLAFQGIEFAYSTWAQPSSGFVEEQANTYYLTAADFPLRTVSTHRPTAAVEVLAGSSVTFARCVFAHLGGGGLTFAGGTSGSAVRGCLFTDISGNGVQVGDPSQPHPTDTRLVDTGDAVDNCAVHDCGLEYHGACGIIAWWTSGLTLSHNTLFNLPYTGVSVGWGWGDYPGTPTAALTLPNVALNNAVQGNLIYTVCQALNDGAGIYLNSEQSGLLVSGNVVHDAPSLNSGPGGANNGGFYLDDGSRYDVVQGNIVYNTPGFNVHTNDNRGDTLVRYNTLDAGNHFDQAGAETGTSGAGPNVYQFNLTAAAASDPSVLAGAGLQAAYLDLLTLTP